MSFKEDRVDEFRENFMKHKDEIMNFEGCDLLDLLKVKNEENVYMTYSYWDDEESLDNYRNSELFKRVWTPTKEMFSQKPEAWTMERVLGIHKL